MLSSSGIIQPDDEEAESLSQGLSSEKLKSGNRDWLGHLYMLLVGVFLQLLLASRRGCMFN